MKWIYIGLKNNEEYFTCVDDDSFELVKDILWKITVDGYVQSVRKQKPVYLHKLVMNMVECRDTIKHLNENRCDNRKENLITHREYKEKIGRDGDGVSSHNNLWTSRIRVNGKHLYLGQYKTENEAKAAYIGACAVLQRQINDVPIPQIIEPTYDEKREAIAYRYALLKKKHQENIFEIIKNNQKPVTNEKGEIFESITEATKAYGRYSTSTLKNHLNGYLKSCWGVRWSFIQKPEPSPNMSEEQ